VAERRRASIDSEALAVFMNGGAAKLQRKCVVDVLLAVPPTIPTHVAHCMLFTHARRQHQASLRAPPATGSW
jgi:hypothetical protein